MLIRKKCFLSSELGGCIAVRARAALSGLLLIHRDLRKVLPNNLFLLFTKIGRFAQDPHLLILGAYWSHVVQG